MLDISSLLSMHIDPLEADFINPKPKKELNSNKSFLKAAKQGVAWFTKSASEIPKGSLIYSNLANIYTSRQLPVQQVLPPQEPAQQIPPPLQAPAAPQAPVQQVPGQQAPNHLDILLDILKADFKEAKKAYNDRIKKLENWHASINTDIKNLNHLSILNLFSLIPDRRDPLYYNEFVCRANADCRITKILTASSSLIFYVLKSSYRVLTIFSVLWPLARRQQALVSERRQQAQANDREWDDNDPIGLESWKEELNNNGYGSDIKIVEKLEKLIRKAFPHTVDWTFPEFFPEDVTTAQRIMSKRCRHAIASVYQAYKISKVSKAREYQKKWITALKLPEQSAEEQKAYFEEEVQKNRENFIKPRLLKWQELSFDEIQQDCMQVGINLANLKQPPQTKAQWLIASNTEEFQLALAEQHVNHAHTLGKLVEQVARKALLKKHQIERNALYYSRLEKYLKIGLCIFKVILSFPLSLYSPVESVIFSLFNDSVKGTPLTKNRLSNLGYIYVLNPLINLKIIDIVACPILRYIGNASNKPHEYSFEGHKIAFKKGSTHLYIWTYQKIIELIQSVIGLGKILIDNYIPGISLKALEANPFFAHFENGLKQEYANSEKWEQGFDDQLKLLRLKDAQGIFKPEKKPSKDQEKVGYSEDPLQQIADMLKERGLEVKNDSDPFEILGQALSNIDPDYVAQSTADFFTTHIKIWPKKNSTDNIFTANAPDIQSKLRETFVLKGKKFVQLYVPAAA